jgi:membrane protein implicated in regulation of membrane protease activity
MRDVDTVTWFAVVVATVPWMLGWEPWVKVATGLGLAACVVVEIRRARRRRAEAPL